MKGTALGLLLLLAAAGCAARGDGEVAITTPEVRLAEGVSPEELERRVARFAPVDIDFDDSLLDEDGRIVVHRLVEASDLLEEIFRLQVWHEDLGYGERLARAEGPGLDAAREYFEIMAGPWDRTEDDEPFLDVGPKPPGAGYYPPGTTREAIEAWLAAHPADSAAFTSYTTVIERRGDSLFAVPYSEAYDDRLERAAALLEEAGERADHPSLADFLRKRAASFRTNDYVESEIAWMRLEGNLVEPTIGPYEVYEDELMGWKAAFESFVAIKDPEASGQLDVLVSHLRDLEAALPVDDRYKSLDRSFASPLSVVDLVYASGDAREGIQAIAFNLPNDPRVTEEHGTKKVMLRNVIEAKFEKILKPIAERLLDPELLAGVGPRAFFIFVAMHELAHGLGPRTVQGSDTPSSVALGPAYSPIEEAKADVVGVLSLAELTDRRVYTEDFLREVYVSAVANLFRCVRFGTSEAHGKGCAVELQAFLDAGAITTLDGGRFGVDLAKIRPAYAELARTLITLEATGDGEAAERLLAEKGSLPPAVETAVARLEDVPVDVRPSYAVVAKMESWRSESVPE